MMRSLFAGASGLRNHQTRMDVIGDNIANVNTLGFKSTRVQFASVLGQSIAGATAPTEDRGGRNPMQIGLGSSLGAISMQYLQGGLQSTGIITDMSLEGEGLFVLGSGNRRFYTRAGSFNFDANGLLTDPFTGYAVMGYNADSSGSIRTTGEVEKIVLPFKQSSPARATTELELGGNLNADSLALGTILDTKGLMDAVTSSAATTDTLLTNLENDGGTDTELATGDLITIGARVGGVDITPVVYTVALTSKLSDLLAEIETALGLTAGSVTVDTDGSLRVHGEVGTGNEITDLRIRATDSTGTTSRTLFDAAMTTTSLQDARDAEVYSMSRVVFDSLGFEHAVTLTFTRTQNAGEWSWAATVGGEASISSGDTGTVRFGVDGSLEAFTYTGGLNEMHIEPNSGATVMTLDLNPGSVGSLDGLSGFSSTSTAVVRAQDGYGSGSLDSITIDQNGVIVGVFSNGVTRNLAQLAVALFTNPSGLQRSEGNAFVSSTNSGDSLIGTLGGRISGRLLPGTLEMSNVDLAIEFTNMVIAQRGFQANARIISTADDMLVELVNLKR